MGSVGFELWVSRLETGDVTSGSLMLDNIASIFSIYTLSYFLCNFAYRIGWKLVWKLFKKWIRYLNRRAICMKIFTIVFGNIFGKWEFNRKCRLEIIVCTHTHMHANHYCDTTYSKSNKIDFFLTYCTPYWRILIKAIYQTFFFVCMCVFVSQPFIIIHIYPIVAIIAHFWRTIYHILKLLTCSCEKLYNMVTISET